VKSERKGHRVLVTGAHGFVGRYCVADLLKRGHEVHCVSSGDRDAELPEGTWHRADLLDVAAAAKLVDRVRPTHLLHLAWETTHGRFWTSPENMGWLVASLELFRAFANCGGRRAVMAGTCAEYRWDDHLCHEWTSPLEPRTLYGACKHALHVAAQGYATHTGVSLAWGRLFFLYGPGERAQRLVPSLVMALLRGEPAVCSHGRQFRDFLHVEDAARAFTALLASGVTGPVNVASGVPTRIGKVAETIGEITGRPDLVRLSATAAAADEPEFLVADVTRLTNEVGWQAKHDLRSGLSQTVEWWRQPVAR
jgi:nucleoside-diphosphate-sugar epimerase